MVSLAWGTGPCRVPPDAKIEEDLLEELDGVVSAKLHSNRSQALEAALRAYLSRLAGSRLARECAKLDPAEERALANLGMELDQWPDY